MDNKVSRIKDKKYTKVVHKLNFFDLSEMSVVIYDSTSPTVPECGGETPISSRGAK